MKIRSKKLITLSALFTLIFLTSSVSFKQVHGALTPPSVYDYYYRYTSGAFTLGVNGGTSSSNPLYSRTSSSGYFNYQSTWNHSTHSFLDNGLSISLLFNRSNTPWTHTGTAYYPSTSDLGSDSTVGTVSRKFSITIQNTTQFDYKMFLDVSSTSSFTYASILTYNLQGTTTNFYGYARTGNLNNANFAIPAFTTMEYYFDEANGAIYFSAFYLDKLGTSLTYVEGYDNGYSDGLDGDAYDQGYQDGLTNNPNLLLNGFMAMTGILVNFALMIINLEVFGISILNVFSILVLFVGVIWILKIIRG